MLGLQLQSVSYCGGESGDGRGDRGGRSGAHDLFVRFWFVKLSGSTTAVIVEEAGAGMAAAVAGTVLSG